MGNPRISRCGKQDEEQGPRERLFSHSKVCSKHTDTDHGRVRVDIHETRRSTAENKGSVSSVPLSGLQASVQILRRGNVPAEPMTAPDPL